MSMFLHSVLFQMTEEQQQKWLQPLLDYELIGTYAQTELGHVGKVVTHAIVAARLITRGKDHGIHMFMCQLRSMEDHTPLPGIELGDIGPKLGYANIDNGFLRLDHVNPDGSYVAPSHSKLSYNSMVQIRTGMVLDMGSGLVKGSTIATRYSAVRRQTELIAIEIAFLMCGQQLLENYRSYISQTENGDFSALPELHSSTAGLKAFATERCRQGLEVLRMASGGHGFSSASTFPELYGSYAPACAYEGENTVMLLQTARMVSQGARCLEADLKGGMSNATAWNNNHLHLLAGSNAHCHLFVLDTINQAVENAVCEDATKRILRTLVQFYALDGIVENKGEFLESGYLSINQVDLVSKQLINLLAVIRPNAVSLVDAFDIHDDKLGSVLGRYDGNVYENLYKWA
ncbi:Peroxisomal acyl-coenzyme A oxidase 1 [Holothuria leucospilota]|uniref:Peroxisomal acyl-coenzyme A oxidase 1 n=1 Tax=Holothuria leucospilota TaxID=206669 RepID=A0A9Q0YAH4_HOLLE|nr:Peroxisomal acyl-coenzyme A oxidase 1 [Holothuria leucospilota]